MTWSGTLSATSRRTVVVGGLVAVLFAAAGTTSLTSHIPQDPAAPAAQAQQDPLKFTHNGDMLLLWQIQPARAAGFESAWLEIKAATAQNSDPVIQAFGRTLNISKVVLDPGGPAAIYVFHLAPVSTTQSYNPVALLFTLLKAPTPDPSVTPAPPQPPGTFTYEQATAIFEKINESWLPNGITPWPLQKLN